MPRELNKRPDGPGTLLAQFLIDNWPSNSPTNAELAQRWDYNAAGIISMWKAGNSKVPIEMLPELATFLGVDLAMLLPLWVEQYDDPRSKKRVNNVAVQQAFQRMITGNEFKIIQRIRKLFKAQKKLDPVLTAKQLQAIEHVVADDMFANLVIDEFNKGSAGKLGKKPEKVVTGEAGA
jgi:hypothetical protein